MSEGVKPCPFCGEQPKITLSGNEGIDSFSECSLKTHIVGPIDASLWQNAYCWKSRDQWRELALEYRKVLERVDDFDVDNLEICKKALSLPLSEDQGNRLLEER